MKNLDGKRLPGPAKPWSKPWPRRILDFILQTGGCRCGEGMACAEGAACAECLSSGESAACVDRACPCSYKELCAIPEWTTEHDDESLNPDQPTLNSVPVGVKARIGKLFLPLALKKRLLSLGLTQGTEVGVISNEKGRMIIAVRDSRLGLSPPVASKITYKSA